LRTIYYYTSLRSKTICEKHSKVTTSPSKFTGSNLQHHYLCFCVACFISGQSGHYLRKLRTRYPEYPDICVTNCVQSVLSYRLAYSTPLGISLFTPSRHLEHLEVLSLFFKKLGERHATSLRDEISGHIPRIYRATSSCFFQLSDFDPAVQ
jgi:hypothetical protein